MIALRAPHTFGNTARRRAALVAYVGSSLATQSLAQQPLHTWDFRQGPGEWWAANGVAPLTVQDGRLVVRVVGFDPFIHCSRGPCLAIQGNDRQFIRMKARCNVKGGAEFFWAASTEGKDSGFEASKQIAFTLPGDNQLHTYNVFPGWEGKVTRLRFDPPGGEKEGVVVEIESVEILELPPSPRSEGPVWEFAGTLAGFVPARDIEDVKVKTDGAELVGHGSAPTVAISKLSLDADSLPWLTVDAGATESTVLTVRWSDEEGKFQPGAQATARLPQRKTHHALKLADRRGWQGRITGLQVSWQADDQPVTMQFRKLGLGGTPLGPPCADVLSLGFDRAFAFLGQSVTLGVVIRNSGGEPLSGASVQARGPGDPEPAPIPALAPGQDTPVRLRLKPTQLGELGYNVSLGRHGGGGAARLFVTHPLPPTAPEQGATVARDQAVLASGTVRLRAPGFEQATIRTGSTRFGPLFLELKRGGSWRAVATLPAVGAVQLSAQRREELAAATATPLRGGMPGLRFEEAVLDGSGRRWTATAEYRLTVDPHRIDVTHTLKAGGPGAVYRFDGPQLRVGEGSFGSAKYEALLPGLEYLEGGEVSSSDRDIAPPGDLRVVSHPNRICIPVQAVTSPDKDLVALLWDNRQKWLGEHDQPAALFASPNLVESADPRIDLAAAGPPRSANNHLLGLFLPSVPEFVHENELQAQRPVELQAGQELMLRSSLYVKPNADVLDAVTEWCRLFKPGAIGDPPMALKEHYALSLRGFEELLYTEGKGWAGVKGWAPGKNPGTALMYLYLAKELGQPELRRLAIERIAGTNALPLSLHVGSVAQALLQARTAGFGQLGHREPDGTWVFHPSEKTQSLGKAGDTNVGMGAAPVHAILKAAAQTADPRLLMEGLKGLDWLRKWRIPRGSQVWEIPLHAPDILASAHCCEAFLWGYRLTGDRSYLADAVYWAKTGLPFVYFWQTPEEGLEPMRGGTIPIFGATFYSGSWFGRLVQWCGLEYAKALLDLAEFDDSFVWKRVANDITVSGWRQQQTKDGYQGLYPDSWGMLDGTISWGLMLGPQRLVQNQLDLDGRHPDGDMRLFRSGKNLVSLLAPGQLGDVAAGNAKGGECVADLGEGPFDLAFSHTFDLDPTACVAVVGVAAPTAVTVDGAPLAAAADLDAVKSGWSVAPELPSVVLKLAQAAGRPVKVALSGLRVSPVAVARTRWTFDADAEGWRPEHDLGPLEVRDGSLVCAPTGGDPYLSTALMSVPAADFTKVVVRCRLPQDKAAAPSSFQVFWRTQEGGYVPERSATASLPPGRDWHEVVVNVGEVAAWRTMLTGLRIDPPGAGLEIDEVRLAK